MDTEVIFKKIKDDMQKSVDHVISEFATLHTGKANPSMIEGITVDVYGSSMKLRDVAAITTPDLPNPANSSLGQRNGCPYRKGTYRCKTWY